MKPKPKPRQSDMDSQCRNKVRDCIVDAMRIVEDAIPGGTDSQKKKWIVRHVDDLIVLPEPFDTVGDVILMIAVEVAFAVKNGSK